MKINNVKCSNCGAVIQVEEGKQIQYCAYCGNQMILEDENSTTTTTNYNHRYIDEAEVKKVEIEAMKIEAEKEIKLKENERKQELDKEFKSNSKSLLIGWVISLVVLLILGFIDPGFNVLLTADFIIGIIVAFKRMNRK